MLTAILTLCAGVLIIGALMYLVDRAPFIDAEAKTVVHWIFLVVLVVFVIYALLGMLGLVNVPFAHVGTVRTLRG